MDLSYTKQDRTPIPQALPFPLGMGVLLFLVCFELYLTHLTPLFMDDDSPETITAAFSLGLQHPPGYALLSLTQRLLCLLPVGNPGFRINLGSACLGAANTVLILFLSRKIFQRLIPGGFGPFSVFPAGICSLCAALIPAFSPTFWEKSLGAKGFLYQGASSLALLMLACLLKDSAQGGDKDSSSRSSSWFLLAVLLFGLGFGWHWETQVLFIPILFMFKKPFPKDSLLKPCAMGLSFLLTGASVLLYLPVRARLHPVLDLGEPVNARLFMDDFFRYYTSQHDLGLASTFWGVLRGQLPWLRLSQLFQTILDIQGRAITRHLWGEIGPGVLLLALLGLIVWMKSKERRMLWALSTPLVLLALALCSASWIPSGPLADWYVDNFLLPFNWGAGLFAGVGLYALGIRAGGLLASKSRWKWLGSFFALAVLPLPPLLQQETGADLSHQVLRYDYGVNLMKSLPKNTVFLAEADEDYFTLYYLQIVEKKRPDISMVPAFTLFETWGVEQAEGFYPELGLTDRPQAYPDPYHRIESALSEIVGNNLGRRPIGYSYFEGAFHRYYLSSHPSLLAEKSGIALLLAPPNRKTIPALSLGQIRARHWSTNPSNTHPTLQGIWTVYNLAAQSTPSGQSDGH